MAMLFNYNKEFKNTFELVFNSSIQSEKNLVINTDEYKFSINYANSNDLRVSSIIVSSKNQLIEQKQFSIASNHLINTIIEKINKNTEFKFIFEDIANIKIGKIIERKSHPKSEKLFVLKVNFGEYSKTIITNTTYTTEGKYLAWYMNGSITPGGLIIKNGEVMGVMSEGMLCSADSLSLSEYTNEFENNVLAKISEPDNYLGKNIETVYTELINKTEEK
ncbi:tRNA-binding protein [Mycoplasma sp. CSL7475-4]|uniref:TyrS-associated PheT N-terminal domain-related protein TapR n=1 Tax=Mycoplasma sp. CSL7475-4 TaxID=2973942 RepID=UPI00216AEF38|nr:tRNA-binding protein [Mycoplasma sp. CSL7475-4]MCS4536565.1 tRNA-binding protein [Mycoplasma sp. CSL7475-4]